MSSWLQNSYATSESVDLNRTNETFESSTASAIPRVILSDNDLALKGMHAASDFLSGSTVIDENGVLKLLWTILSVFQYKLLLMSSNLLDVC